MRILYFGVDRYLKNKKVNKKKLSSEIDFVKYLFCYQLYLKLQCRPLLQF